MRIKIAKSLILLIILSQFYYPSVSSVTEFGLSLSGIFLLIARLEISVPFVLIILLPEITTAFVRKKQVNFFSIVYLASIIWLILISILAYNFSQKTILVETFSFYTAIAHYLGAFYIFLVMVWFFQYSGKDNGFYYKLFFALSVFSSVWCLKPLLFQGDFHLGILNIANFHLGEESESSAGLVYLYGFGFRYQGFTSSPTQQAILSSFALILSLIYLKYDNTRRNLFKKILLIIVVLLSTAAIFLTQTRTYIFLLPLLVGFIFFRKKYLSVKQIFFLISAFFLVIIIGYIFIKDKPDDFSLERIASVDDDRLQIASFFLNATLSETRSFFFGNGFLYYYIHPLLRPDGELLNGHSVIIDIIAQFGFILGPIIFMFFMTYLFKIYFNQQKNENFRDKIIIQSLVILYGFSILITGNFYATDFSGIFFAFLFAQFSSIRKLTNINGIGDNNILLESSK